MSEKQFRVKLDELDELRKAVALRERMHTHWMGHDGELALIEPVIVRRRWRPNKQTHSEIVMGREERDAFLEWLMFDASRKRVQIAALESELFTEGAQQHG